MLPIEVGDAPEALPPTEVECSGIPVVLEGSIIGVMTPLKTKGVDFTLTLTQASGVQSPTKFEGGPQEVLMTSVAGGAFEQTGAQTTLAIVMSSETEVTS